MVGRGRLVAVLGAVGVIAACAQAPMAGGPAATPVPGFPVGPEVRPRWTSCQAEAPDLETRAGNDALSLPPLAGDFAPVAVVMCVPQPVRRPDGGDDMAAVESRGEDIAALLAALRLPDEAQTDGACRADLPGVPFFVLQDAAGRWVRPGVPADACGRIRDEVTAAVSGLRLTPVSSRPLPEVESDGAAAAGCSRRYADMVAVTAANGTAHRTGDPPVAGAVRLCVYAVPAAERGSAKPAGEFRHGGELPAERWRAIAGRLTGLPPAAPCTAHAGRFAVLTPVSPTAGGGEVWVELDGCRRVVVAPTGGRRGLGQASDELIALLR